MSHFVQCALQKNNEHQVAWLPSTFAKVGKFLELNGDNGWKVVLVNSAMDEKYVTERKLWGLDLPKGQRTER